MARLRREPSTGEIAVVLRCSNAEAAALCHCSPALIKRWRAALHAVVENSSAFKPATGSLASRPCRSPRRVKNGSASISTRGGLAPQPPGRPRRILPPALVASLGRYSDAELARQYDVPKNSVRNHRRRQGTPAKPRLSRPSRRC